MTRSTAKLSVLVLSLLFASALSASADSIRARRELCETAVRDLPNRTQVILNRVVDGDTVNVGVGNPVVNLGVRFLGIDTPETHYEGMNQGEWAVRAHHYLESLLQDATRVSLEFEGDRCDNYGRILAYVYSGKRMLNRAVLRQGLAVNYCIYPNIRYCASFARIVEQNMRRGTGIFSDSSVEVPYVWRRLVSERPFDKFVGNIATHEVYRPEHYTFVPLWDRIFFYTLREMPSPYELVPNEQN